MKQIYELQWIKNLRRKTNEFAEICLSKTSPDITFCESKQKLKSLPILLYYNIKFV